ncbi:hypothetical protein CYCD_13440 [Tenuifilaceae bacterium CYCD]|nr:hypothetical protein CYCD_13440 [Tenuifilaceae bacterium CYCD]
MKKLTTLLVGLIIAQATIAQVPYKVITVNGEIMAKKAKVTLQNGIEVKSDDNFDFLKPNSRAALINSDYGRVVLTETNVANAFSKAAFAPAISTVSSRGASMTTLADLKGFFSGNMLIIDKLDQKIDASAFPMNDQKHFFVRYTYNNETINKKLNFNGDIITINPEEIFSIDGKAIENPDQISEVTLFYYDSSNDTPESILINSFHPVFVKTANIKGEVKTIVDEFQNKSYEMIISEVYDYLNNFYGYMEKEELEKWLNSNFELKKE